MSGAHDLDFDWLVIGSGFGGSVSALRLSEKGYSVGVLECGRRFADADLPKATSDVRAYTWMPRFGMHGILRVTLFRDVVILSGAGVGGGSLVYAQMLYRAADGFRSRFEAACGEPADLDPFYEAAERMLGVVTYPRRTLRDRLMTETAAELGYGHSFHPSPIGVFRGAPGVTVPDPYFGGDGPDRTGCIDCGECLVACRHGAKNTLDKNYLWFAERLGARVVPGRLVKDVRPLGDGDGSDGYAVVSERPGAWGRRERQALRARHVVVAAGALGTNSLLASCRSRGSLPRLSHRLGHEVRTNSESITAVTARDPDADFSDGVAVTGSVWPSDDTHIEVGTWGAASDSTALCFVPLTPQGTRLTRPLKLARAILRAPGDAAITSRPRGWSRRTIFVGAMQTREGSIRFRSRRRLLGSGVRLQTLQDPHNPNPSFIPELYEYTKRLAETVNGIPQSWITEAIRNIPVTAHVLGGAVVGTSPETGVVDSRHRVFGYRNLLVCDGASVPCNPGVNPSLTIAAMAERAMSLIEPKATQAEAWTSSAMTSS